jgi:hypothetical protein
VGRGGGLAGLLSNSLDGHGHDALRNLGIVDEEDISRYGRISIAVTEWVSV